MIKLEYIESTGTQYIDTGVVFSKGIRVVGKVIPKNTIGVNPIASSYDEQWVCGVRIRDGQWNPASGVRFDYKVGSVVSGTEYSIDISNINGRYLTIIDGSTIGDYQSSQNNFSTTPITIFANGESPINGIKLGNIKLYDYDGTLVRDFIPVIYRNVVCMFDLVSNQHFYNAGTGDFIAGPIVNN